MPTRSGASSSSMHTASSFSSSILDGSPSRQSPNRRTPRKSPFKDFHQSPSRKMHIEFDLMLSRSDREFNERLDHIDAERAKINDEKLARAAQEHHKVQEGAQLEIQRLALEREREQRRREEAQRKEIDRLHQEKIRREAEAQQQKLEAKRREEEAARQAAERQRQIQEADARVRAQKEQEEMARRQKAEAEKQAKDAAIAAQQAWRQQQKQQQQQQQPQPQPQPQPSAAAKDTPAPVPPPTAISAHPTSTHPATPVTEEIHAEYLEIHARLKAFRKDFETKHKQPGSPLKGLVGDTRRNMRKRLGQVTTVRKDSQAAINRLRQECFDKASHPEGPKIDIRPYLASNQVPESTTEADAQYPALLLYAWICFEKSIIAQWSQEAAKEDHTIIQELGLIAASLFSDARYQWRNRVPLTDTLLAKLHRKCPMMFGISGNTTTKQGLTRLGLDKYGGSDTEQNQYLQTATGMGAGYAALSLRQFSGSNPAVPMADYWRAVASICKTPSEALYPGHFMCLKGLLRDFIKRFLQFYGLPAKALVRYATRTLPDRAPKERPGVKDAANIVRTLPDSWKVTLGFDVDQ